MNKSELIDAIAKVQGPDANRPHLSKKSIAELREVLARWQAIMGTTDAEIRRHCNANFIR